MLRAAAGVTVTITTGSRVGLAQVAGISGVADFREYGDANPDTGPGRRFVMRAVLKRLVSVIAYASLTATIIATPVLIENAVASAATCGSGATMNFVAHEDDDLLSQSPNLLREIKSGKCLRTVYALAGDAGENDSYWQDRERGVRAAYAQMMGVSNSWSQSDAGIPVT